MPDGALERAELERVDALAERLMDHLQADEGVIARLHIHGAQSKAIQGRVGSLLEAELGFAPEVVLTPDEGLVTRARPDFYYPLSPTTGVIAEVERGGTTANNHDLKDLWKAHIAINANHLFLVVPNELFNENGAVRERPFPKVVRRMGAFFTTPRTAVDVLSVHIFGY
ncbi:hypothetical protein DV701_12260 [Ornithinimicrobium avium]|uniref:Uncharacterized protein n=2 Tax=Ornithinimicrobium avium TaxID=2283195 RepID=A0A345NP28_9MICO|nr:hypothetical protein DV701_12260 [Ornithinimicrobium avium]